MKKIFALFLASALSGSLAAQTEVRNYTPGITDNGITYFLPKTALRFTVTAVRRHYTPGEYCLYAERFLRLKDAVQAERDEWEIKTVEMTPYGVADKSKAYTIRLVPKTSAPLAALADDGRLLAVNKDAPEEEPLPMAAVIPGTDNNLNGAKYKTEEILSAGNLTKMAELTAAEIYDIRENRSLLTKGQADFMPKDGEQLKLMLNSLETQETALLQLFAGTMREETHVATFDFVPNGEAADSILFRFSRHLGFVDADDLAGKPYRVSVTDLKTLPAEVIDPKAKAKKEVDDLRYMVPGRAEVKLCADNAELLSQTLPIAQFGRVEHLGGDLFNKKYTTRVTLSPVTGGIVRVEAEEPK